MSKTDTSQRMLNWLENEKKKDDLAEKSYKNKILREIKQYKKEELFPVPKKLTLWQKIKILVLGN
jgi:hypothetical protein